LLLPLLLLDPVLVGLALGVEATVGLEPPMLVLPVGEDPPVLWANGSEKVADGEDPPVGTLPPEPPVRVSVGTLNPSELQSEVTSSKLDCNS